MLSERGEAAWLAAAMLREREGIRKQCAEVVGQGDVLKRVRTIESWQEREKVQTVPEQQAVAVVQGGFRSLESLIAM
jgi:hypothetical protein